MNDLLWKMREEAYYYYYFVVYKKKKENSELSKTRTCMWICMYINYGVVTDSVWPG